MSFVTHCAGSDDAVRADGDAVQDDRVRADPDVVADGDASAVCGWRKIGWSGRCRG